MNIQNWGMGQIMQLPDYLFGRRFLITCEVRVGPATRAWDISEVALPEKCVIWELVIKGMGIIGMMTTVRIALGDQLPTAVAMFNALDPLFMGLGAQGAEPRDFLLLERAGVAFRRLRMPVAAQGRRLVIEAISPEILTAAVVVGIVVSGVPKEVPDWLGSANLRNL